MSQSFNSQYDDHQDDEQAYLEQQAAQSQSTDEQGSVSRLSVDSETDADVHDMQDRLNLVDHLFRNAPFALPQSDFAERVIRAIKNRTPSTFDRNRATGVVLGLSSAAGATLALLGISLTIAAIFFINSEAIIDALVSGGTFFNLGLSSLAQSSAELFTENPLVMLILTVGAITPLLGWLISRRNISTNR